MKEHDELVLMNVCWELGMLDERYSNVAEWRLLRDCVRLDDRSGMQCHYDTVCALFDGSPGKLADLHRLGEFMRVRIPDAVRDAYATLRWIREQ